MKYQALAEAALRAPFGAGLIRFQHSIGLQLLISFGLYSLAAFVALFLPDIFFLMQKRKK